MYITFTNIYTLYIHNYIYIYIYIYTLYIYKFSLGEYKVKRSIKFISQSRHHINPHLCSFF